MFQHYKSVFQLSPLRARTLGTTSFSLVQSLFLSGAQISRVHPYCLALCVCVGCRACIVIHPFCAGMGYSSVPSINKTFFFSKASSTFLIWREAFFRGPTLLGEDETSNPND